MFPGAAIDNSTDLHGLHAELCGDGLHATSRAIQSPDFHNVSRSQLGISVRFSAERLFASLADAILLIFRACGSKQMTRPEAAAIVAAMADMKPFGNGPNGVHVSESMHGHMPTKLRVPQLGIAVLLKAARPFKAAIPLGDTLKHLLEAVVITHLMFLKHNLIIQQRIRLWPTP